MLHISYIFLITCLNMDYFFVSWSWRNIPQVQPFRWSYDILSPCGWSCRVMLFGMSLVSLHNHPSDAPRPWWNARCHGRRRGIKQKQQKRGKFWWENREKWYNYNYIYIYYYYYYYYYFYYYYYYYNNNNNNNKYIYIHPWYSNMAMENPVSKCFAR